MGDSQGEEQGTYSLSWGRQTCRARENEFEDQFSYFVRVTWECDVTRRLRSLNKGFHSLPQAILATPKTTPR